MDSINVYCHCDPDQDGLIVEATSTDDKWVIDVSERLLCLKHVDELRKAVLLQLEPIFKAHKSTFFLARTSDNSLIMRDVVNRGIEERYFDYFREYYHKMAPFVNAISTLSSIPTRVFTSDQVVSFKDYLRTRFYNEFIRPQDIYAELTIYLTSETQLLGLISFFRPQNKPIFSEEDRVNGKRVVTYLSAALERALALEHVDQKDAVVNSIASEIPNRGVVLLDQHMQPFYISEMAHNILSLLYEVHRGGKGDFAMAPQLCLWLEQRKRVLSLANHPETDGERIDLMSKDKKCNVSISLRLVDLPQRRPFFVLTLESQAPALYLMQYFRKTGLSKRETDVVMLVCEGLSNAEIAARLFISEYTVANHLRSIYEKTHVNNRTSLAHYVNSLLLRQSGASITDSVNPYTRRSAQFGPADFPTAYR